MTLANGLMFMDWVVAVSLTLFGTWLACRLFKSSPPPLDQAFGLYPVSILKPVKGIEAGMRESLETFFHLNYPHFELIFSVAAKTDPACALVRDLLRTYPHIHASLIVGDVNAGLNPKVNNLIKSYEKAQHDWLLISDSNVRVGSQYLRDMVAHLKDGVGIVTCVVAGRNPVGIGGHLEAIILNTFYARGMLIAAAFGRPCVVGKSMLFRRSTAERFGGIRVLARYLAEDYMAGEAMRSLGLRVVIATLPVYQHIDQHSMRAFWSRHLRWGRIRKAQAPLLFVIEPWLGSVVSGVLGAIVFTSHFGWSLPLFISLHVGFWSLGDLILMSQLEPKLNIQAVFYGLMRELLALPLWFSVASGSTVNWRGQELKLQSDGMLKMSESGI